MVAPIGPLGFWLDCELVLGLGLGLGGIRLGFVLDKNAFNDIRLNLALDLKSLN